MAELPAGHCLYMAPERSDLRRLRQRHHSSYVSTSAAMVQPVTAQHQIEARCALRQLNSNARQIASTTQGPRLPTLSLTDPTRAGSAPTTSCLVPPIRWVLIETAVPLPSPAVHRHRSGSIQEALTRCPCRSRTTPAPLSLLGFQRTATRRFLRLSQRSATHGGPFTDPVARTGQDPTPGTRILSLLSPPTLTPVLTLASDQRLDWAGALVVHCTPILVGQCSLY